MILLIILVLVIIKYNYLFVNKQQLNNPNDPITIRTKMETISLLYNDDQTSSIIDINLIPNDNHNVHNITIQSQFGNRLNFLINNDNKKFNVNDVHNLLKLLYDKLKIQYIHGSNVVDYVFKYNLTYSPLNISECEFIRLIFERIFDPINESNRSKLINDLLYQINDCYQIDDNRICCIDGRILRYMQPFELYDNQNELWTNIPLWVYKQEIYDKCAQIVNEYITSLSDDEQLVYFKQNPTKTEENIINKWNCNIINKLESIFDDIYIKTNILKKDQLDKITEPCYQSIKN